MSAMVASQENWIEATTIGDLIDRAATRSSGDAVVFPDVRVSYPELSRLSGLFACRLRALGIGARDKVGILMPNSLDFVIALLGATKLGAVAVPVNGRFKRDELNHVIAHADIKVLLTSSGPVPSTDYPKLIAEVFPDIARRSTDELRLSVAPLLRHVVDFSGDTPGFMTRGDFEIETDSVDNVEVRKMQHRVCVRDVALLMYTSGTTAKPKGCLLTHEALVRHGINVARSRFFLTPEDRYWDPLPLFHIGGIVPMLSCFSTPCAYVHTGHFDADVALAQLEDERCTVAYPAFETIWLGIVNHPKLVDADLHRLRLIQNIATPERLAYMQERMPWITEVSSYGATESSSNLTLSLPDDSYEVRMQTLGRPLPGIEIKIVDFESRRELENGEVGELAFRGYSRFEGYYKDPELTAALIDEDGWFYSGDLASVDDGGNLIYNGRLKDMLKVGGENVAAIEIEDFISHHPAVDIVQIVGAPDRRYSEVPAAYIQLKPDAVLDEEEIIEYCVGKIASYKVPRYVRFVTEWPMSGTKIQKFILREMIALELTQSNIVEAPLPNKRNSARGS